MNTKLGRSNSHLVAGRLLGRNAVWNLGGNLVPMAIAVVCIPILIKALGTERFGILTLAWAIIGYGGLFDLGLGRALTQVIATKLGSGEGEHELADLVWTCLCLLFLFGVCGTIVLVLLSPVLVNNLLHISGSFNPEGLFSFRVLALSLPCVISVSGLRGILEAQQKFAAINVLRVPMNSLMYAGPLLALLWSKTLFSVVSVLVICRVLGWIAHLVACVAVVPFLRKKFTFRWRLILPLIEMGGWMTISNVVGPLMVTLDRFVVGALVSVSAVAYYATPYEAITKLWIIPWALVGVMFPAFSTSFVQDPRRTVLLYSRTLKYLSMMLFPITLVIFVYAQDGLMLWLGAGFARHSFRVLQILTIGVIVNSLAQVPLAVVQGIGRADISAKLHVMELPFYLVGLYLLTKVYGIEGAAAAWCLRAVADALLLFVFSSKLLAAPAFLRIRNLALATVACLTFVLGMLPQTVLSKALFLLSAFVVLGAVTWFSLLSQQERDFAHGLSGNLPWPSSN